jgi:hypothetical protein
MVEASKTTETADIAEMSPENLMVAVATTTGTTEDTAADQTSRAETTIIIGATTAVTWTVTEAATTREVHKEEVEAAIVMIDGARHPETESVSVSDHSSTRALRAAAVLEAVLQRLSLPRSILSQTSTR